MSMTTLERFTALVEAWGADPARWPAAERPAALALLETSTAARAVVEREKRLDLALDLTPPAAPPPAALARRLAGLAADPRSLWTDLLALFGGWRPAAAALALCIAAGVVLGTAVPTAQEAETQVVYEAALPDYAQLTTSYLDH